MDDEDYSKNESFFVELEDPITELNEKQGDVASKIKTFNNNHNLNR